MAGNPPPGRGPLRRLGHYFLRGLIIVAPAGITIYFTWITIRWMDRLLSFGIPGLGLVVTIGLIILIGALASNFITQTVLTSFDRIMERVPFVRLLYTSSKDLLNAFVGEHRRFTKGVRVALTPDGSISVLGFVTAESLEHLGLGGLVAVYLPQSYNFAGNLILAPASQISPVTGDSASLMAFIVSGGVSGTAEDPRLPVAKQDSPR